MSQLASKKVGASCLLILAAALIVFPVFFRFAAPVLAHKFYIDFLYQNFPYAIWALLIGVPAYILSNRLSRRHENTRIIVLLAGLLAVILGGMLMHDAKMVEVHKDAHWTRLEQMIPINTGHVRFTPFQISQTLFENSFDRTPYKAGSIDPIVQGDNFGYIAPMAPDGIWNVLLKTTPGLLFYNDSRGIPDHQRITEIDQEFLVGEELEVMDDAMRVLYDADFFADYPEIYYAQVGNVWHLVAPRIVYDLRLSYVVPVLVPCWGGVVLVDPKGNVTNLTVPEAQEKLGSRGIRIFPESLALSYVESERYDHGIIGAYIKREGKIDVPALPDKNQMPFYCSLADGQYWVTTVEPATTSQALSRVYYVNACTGSRLAYHIPSGNNLLGPNAAHSYAKLPGYTWVEKSGTDEEGNFRLIEPRFLPRAEAGDVTVYWMFTVTTRNYEGITATVCVNTSTQKPLEFKTREAFYGWLDGSAIPLPDITVPPAEEGGSLERIEHLVEELRQEIQKLKTERK